MLITPASLNFFFTEVKTNFELGAIKRAIMWPKVAERLTSGSASNTYSWLAEIPGFREWIGPRVFHNLAARAYSVRNRDWEDGFAVPRNALEDDQYGIYGRYSQLLGEQSAMLWDNLVFDALQAGNATTGFDGQFFFDTDHPVNMDDAGAGTYSNSVTATDLTAANLAILSTNMMAYKGESGRSLEIVPNLLVVPPQLAVKGAEALAPIMAQNNAAVANQFASGVVTGKALEIVVVPRLSNQPTVYYLLSTDRLKPIILQVRREPVITSKQSLTDDNVFYNREFVFGADGRGAAGYGLPFTAIRAVTV